MTESPFGDCRDRTSELAAPGRELVFEARGMVVVWDASDQRVFLEAAKALGQDVGGDRFRRGQQVAEALAAAEQIADEQEGPAVTDQIESASDRAR